MNKLLIFILLNITFITFGCAQPISRDLNIVYKHNKLCIYINNEKSFLSQDNTFVVFLGEVEVGKPFNVIYSKDYKNSQFPLVLSQCLMVPIKNLTFNKIYEINLETNKNFSQRFCLKRNENKTELIIINDGRQKCEV